MKVISLLQPWATLVVMGAKKIETRSWNTKYRGPLLIHASATKKRAYRNINLDFQQQFFSLPLMKYESLPFGKIIGQVTLVDTLPSEYLLNKQFSLTIKDHIFMDHGISEKEKALGDYSPGRFGWLLAEPLVFGQPIAAKGSLGLWEFKEINSPI